MNYVDTAKILELMQECEVDNDGSFVDTIVDNKYGINYFWKVIDMSKFMMKLMEIEDD